MSRTLSCRSTPVDPQFCENHSAPWNLGDTVCQGWEPLPDDHDYPDPSPDGRSTTASDLTCRRCGYTHPSYDRTSMYDQPCPNYEPEPVERPVVLAPLAVDSRSLRMLREALSVAQARIHMVDDPRNAAHTAVLSTLFPLIDAHRPLGPDGKHGDRHTPTCGCDLG